MESNDKLTITVREAAKLVGISEKSAYKNLVTLPDFPVKKVGKRFIIAKTAFLRWLEENSGIPSLKL